MARYRIEPYGVQSVVKAVGQLAEHDLDANAKAVRAAAEAAAAHLDPQSPVRGLLGPYGLAVAGQIKAVYAETANVLTAAVNATNAYIEADIEMARRGAHGVTVTGSYVSGFDGDKAQRGAERAVGGLRNLARVDAMDARDRMSLGDWLGAVQQGQGG